MDDRQSFLDALDALVLDTEEAMADANARLQRGDSPRAVFLDVARAYELALEDATTPLGIEWRR